jgi:tight adherence protein C
MLPVLRTLIILTLALGAAGIIRLCWSVPVAPVPRLGRRGQERRRAMDERPALRAVEPVLRFLAGAVSPLPLGRLREWQERELRRADFWLGLTPDEFSALSLITAFSGLLAGFVLAHLSGVTLLLGGVGFALGLLLPAVQCRENSRQRAKEVSRGLPHAIEICALCMGAGLDFPGALRLVAGPKSRGALAHEFAAILEELELGHTRREALANFADRVPSSAVRDFVAAVIQAEQKGNPLAKVIQTQGRLLSQRRSVAAEEAAARAGVLMVAPMMLLVLCVLALLLGPFLTRGFEF